MYVPLHFRFEDQEALIAFMTQYSFAAIITQHGEKLLATHLPFVVERRQDQLFLTAHFAAANEQATMIEAGQSIVIFTGPHGYISPVHYDKKASVPTWDYVAVHAYGKATILREQQEVRQLLGKMILFYEPAYLEQWKHLPEPFKSGMSSGIVAFELAVNNLQGQRKLSQNKSDGERARIVAHLQQQGDQAASELATLIAHP